MLDAKKIKESLSIGDIVKIVESLGGEQSFKYNHQGNLIFSTICHNISNGSSKLYYHPTSYQFHCYTGCECNFNIFELIMKNRQLHGIDCKFYDALTYVADMTDKHYTQNVQYIKERNTLIKDWEFILRYNVKKTEIPKLQQHSHVILDCFHETYHQSWIDENISIETMKKFNIKFYLKQNKIIIPHYDIKGNLIGIRGRSLNQDDIDMGKKYMPIILQGIQYNHPLTVNLYGLHKTKYAIKRLKKVAIFESEKSVYKCEEFYGHDNYSVAICGLAMSNCQRTLLLDLCIEEVIFCLDKQYKFDGTDESEAYAKKILKLAQKFTPYVKVYVVWDTEDLLLYKDSPVDRGKEILEKLMQNKIELTMDMEV